MELSDLKSALGELGITMRGEGERVSVELPANSGHFIVGRKTSDGLGIALISTVEVSQRHLDLFRAAGSRAKAVVFELVSYLALFDVEFEVDRFDELPRLIRVAVRWDDRGDSRSLMRSIRTLLRAREGVIHRLRYWAEAVGSDAIPAEVRREASTP